MGYAVGLLKEPIREFSLVSLFLCFLNFVKYSCLIFIFFKKVSHSCLLGCNVFLGGCPHCLCINSIPVPTKYL